MDGIAGVTARVHHIQGLVQSLSGARAAAPAAGSWTAGSSTAGSSTAGSTLTPAGAASSVARISSTTSPTSSFESVLARARAVTGAPPAASSPGAVDADGVPLDLVRYGNGKVPAEALQPLGVGQHRLWAPAAEAFTSMRSAARAAGVQIGVTDSYRSYEAQVDVARRKGLYKNGGLAAVPGTSDHGWGLSLDLKLDDRAQTWMRTHAAEFGFAENTPREPWHWTFQP